MIRFFSGFCSARALSGMKWVGGRGRDSGSFEGGGYGGAVRDWIGRKEILTAVEGGSASAGSDLFSEVLAECLVVGGDGQYRYQVAQQIHEYDEHIETERAPKHNTRFFVIILAESLCHLPSSLLDIIALSGVKTLAV